MVPRKFAWAVTGRVAIALTLLLAVSTAGNIARAAEIKVMSAAAMAPVLKDIAGEFERTSGHKLVIAGDTAGAVVKRFLGGESADVVIVTAPQIAGLVKEGKIEAASSTQVTKVGVGITIKSGTPKPRVASVDDFKNALMAAKAVIYADPAGGGAAGIHVGNIIQKLGIAEQLNSKIVLAKGGDIADVTIGKGSGAIGMTQISEIVGHAGADLVGPLPEELQNYTIFAIGSVTGTKQIDAVNAFTKFLKGPSAAAAIKARGMQPG